MTTTDTSTEQMDTDLDVTVEETGALTRRLVVTVPPDRVADVREQERQELGSSLDLKGFRPGKVPGKVVEERYGEVVQERTVRSAVEDAYREAVESLGLQPVRRPDVRDVKYEQGGALQFRADVEVMPELELERTGGFRIERPSAEVSDEGVDEVLERLRDDHAVWQPVDRRPGESDQVSVRIWPDDEDGDEGEKPEPYRFELGQGSAIPGVEEAIMTLEPGSKDVFEVEFPADFGDEEIAGESRTLHVELMEVKEKGLPDLDNAFAAQVGDFDDLDELRDAIREDLGRHREEEAEEEVRKKLLDSIIEANPFEVPDAMIDNYLDRVLDAPPEADPEEVQEARRSFRPRAETEIKRQLLMDHLVEAGGYEATEEELEERLRELAEQRETDVRQVRRQLARENQLEGMRQHIAAEKLFERLKKDSRIVAA